MTPNSFIPTAYGPAVAGLLNKHPLPELGPGSPQRRLHDSIAALSITPACRAGMWLLFDFLDESHSISQELHTSEGSFWHAIMHRREPDAFNSKYWWRRVGPHTVLKQLREQSPALGYTYTTPEAFVDFCETVRGSKTPDETTARQVQLLEWQLLFDHCYRSATA